MTDPLARSLASSVLRRGAVWTLLMGVNVGLLVAFWRGEQVNLAEQEARSAFQKDLVYRLWASEQGGVYVPATKVVPNPYLSHLPHRDVTTTQGTALTLVNPAYMTRLVHELGQRTFGLKGHITSLNPLRPENRPDPWEAAALAKVDRRPGEVIGVAPIGEVPHLRFLSAMVTQASCLKCHEAQGYRVGDVRGGISVSVPLEPFRTFLSRPTHLLTLGGAAGLWGVGLAAIWWATRREREREHERAHMLAQLQDSQRLESLGFLAGGVAHDMNNVLAAILGLSSSFRTLQPPGEGLGYHLPGLPARSHGGPRASGLFPQGTG